MTTVYILTFKETGEKFYYTSKKAMSLSHTKRDFRVSVNYIANLNFGESNIYENHGIRIEKVQAVGTGDIKTE